MKPEMFMAYRELHVVEIKEILRLWALGHGLRTVASRTGTDRKTVRRYIEAAQVAGLVAGDAERAVDDALVSVVVEAIRPGAPPQVGAMREHCRQHADALRSWASEGCKGPKMVKLLARHTGVTVPLRTLQRFVDEELDLDARAGTVRIVDPDPGRVLEIDFLELGEFKPLGPVGSGAWDRRHRPAVPSA